MSPNETNEISLIWHDNFSDRADGHTEDLEFDDIVALTTVIAKELRSLIPYQESGAGGYDQSMPINNLETIIRQIVSAIPMFYLKFYLNWGSIIRL